MEFIVSNRLFLKKYLLQFIFLLANCVFTHPAFASIKLIVTHPTLHFDYKGEAHEGINLLVTKFIQNRWAVITLVAPGVDFSDPKNDPKCLNGLSADDCSVGYLKYLPNIEKTQILFSEGGEHSMPAADGEVTVLAGGFFTACFAKTFDDVVSTSKAKKIKIVMFLPAIYGRDIGAFYDTTEKRMIQMIRDEKIDSPRIDLNINRVYLNEKGKRQLILGSGDREVEITLINSFEEFKVLANREQVD